MALVNGSEYDHIDLHSVVGGDVTRHMLKDAKARADIAGMATATAEDVGKALKPKTVTNGKVTEWEFGEVGVQVDDTLTQAGKAADAKKTGDEISDLKEDVGTVADAPALYSDTEVYTSTTSGSKMYLTDRYISSNTLIDTITMYVGGNTNGKIIVVNKTSRVVIDVIPVTLTAGLNVITVRKSYSDDVVLGFYATLVMFKSGGATYEDYAFTTVKGVNEATPANASIGDTITDNVVGTNSWYMLYVYWHTISGELANIKSTINKNTSDIDNLGTTLATKEDKTSAVLDNSNLLRYETLESGEYGLVGRWFDYNGKPCTNNDGSEIYIRTNGVTTLTVDLQQITALTVTPYIAYSIDGGAFTRQQISTNTITLPDTGEHIVRIVIDGMTEQETGINKYHNPPDIGIYINGVSANAGNLYGVRPRNKIGMFFGDSLTEGINALGTGANSGVNSATNAFPFYCCNSLDAVSFRVGYGGTGFTRASSFSTAINQIKYYYINKPVSMYYKPDFVVFNYGINDYNASTSAEDYIAAYKQCIDLIRVKYGAVPIFCVVAMTSAQPYSSDIASMCEEYSNTYFVSTDNWNGQTTDGTHPSGTGAKNNGELLANKILEVLGKAFFM